MATARTTKAKTGGDDLDDDLELDADLLASSDAEREEGDADENENDGAEGNADEDDGVDESSSTRGTESAKKRKADGEDEIQEEDESGSDSRRKAEKKRRKKDKEKARKAKRSTKAIEGVNAPTHLTPSALSALLLASIRESYPSATPMEISDLLLPNTSLLQPPTYSLEDLPEGSFAPVQRRIKEILSRGPKLKASAPRVLILALSGLRCADVVRGVRCVRGDGQVAKLFAKHMKYEEQVSYLAKTKVSIAVGTPARIGKLLAEDAIKITPQTTVLLDIGHRDSKTRTLLNLPEVRDELWKSVFSGTTRDKLLTGGARIGAF